MEQRRSRLYSVGKLAFTLARGAMQHGGRAVAERLAGRIREGVDLEQRIPSRPVDREAERPSKLVVTPPSTGTVQREAGTSPGAGPGGALPAGEASSGIAMHAPVEDPAASSRPEAPAASSRSEAPAASSRPEAPAASGMAEASRRTSFQLFQRVRVHRPGDESRVGNIYDRREGEMTRFDVLTHTDGGVPQLLLDIDASVLSLEA